VPELPTGRLTLLFTDVEGSTRLLRELGDGYAHALAEHRRVIRTAVAGAGGVEVDTQGDAFFVVFDSARAAVAAATEICAELAPGQVRVRVGIHTGTPGRTEEGYVGVDVHLAARICAAGHGGQIVLSAAAARELDDSEPLLELGEHRLKDFDDPLALFQVGYEPYPSLRTVSSTNLPRPATSFAGRGEDVEAVVARVRGGSRLLTLTGPAGSGKTRLAIEVAAELVSEFGASVFWVDLGSLRDPGLVLEAVARTLGARGELEAHIGTRRLLLVLDNLEHLVSAGPGLAVLVAHCPNLHVLMTSREVLRLREEVEFPVLPLASHESVRLFCERSGLPAGEEVSALCTALDNLPLAVELAAARTDVLSSRQILERIGQRLDLFRGARDADPRQQTLRAAIQWSYELLRADNACLRTWRCSPAAARSTRLRRWPAPTSTRSRRSSRRASSATAASASGCWRRSAVARSSVASVALEDGRLDDARTFAGQSLELAGPALDRDNACWALELAGAALALSAPERAARLLAAAGALRESLGEKLSGLELTQHERALAAISAALMPESLAAALDAGRRLALDEAVALVLR
jgi:Adenylate and Guanylate cyclase catalytic domain